MLLAFLPPPSLPSFPPPLSHGGVTNYSLGMVPAMVCVKVRGEADGSLHRERRLYLQRLFPQQSQPRDMIEKATTEVVGDSAAAQQHVASQHIKIMLRLSRPLFLRRFLHASVSRPASLAARLPRVAFAAARPPPRSGKCIMPVARIDASGAARYEVVC